MLDLYERLEKTQLNKLEHERIRRSQGRTTTQQVLNFELDYEQAQLSRLRAMSEMLQLIAQMKLYGGN
jgi:outer membrane protein TolC